MVLCYGSPWKLSLIQVSFLALPSVARVAVHIIWTIPAPERGTAGECFPEKEAVGVAMCPAFHRLAIADLIWLIWSIHKCLMRCYACYSMIHLRLNVRSMLWLGNIEPADCDFLEGRDDCLAAGRQGNVGLWLWGGTLEPHHLGMNSPLHLLAVWPWASY